MGAMLGRMAALTVASIVLSLSLLLLITSRNLGEMSNAEVQGRWLVLTVQKAPVVDFVRDYAGPDPPKWVLRLAIVWHQARPASWWWLPPLMLLAMFLINRRSRRKSLE